MTQRDLNRAVAQRTGESVHEIAHRGFGLLTAGPLETEPEPLDWDALDHHRIGVLFPQRLRTAGSF